MKKAVTLIAALVAVLAVTSGAFAAKQYLITSSKQIKHGAISLSDLSRHAHQALQGQQGLQGLQGLAGEKGAAGPTGRDGLNGLAGANGLPGRDGLNGLPGRDGQPGPQGLQGVAGAPGAPGATGLQGLQGPKGDTGPQGQKGDQGLQGPKGEQGPSGVNSPLVFGPYQVSTTDSGFCGNDWAHDTYNVTFVVAPQANGSFVVSELMKGGFKTMAGASPNSTNCDTGAQIDQGITGSLYGDFVVPVAQGADFNPTATLDDSTPCGGICTSDKFFEAFFGKASGYTNSTNYAWQFHYTTPGDANGHWADTDHSIAGDPANGDIKN